MTEPRTVQQVLDWIREGSVRPADAMLPPDEQLKRQYARQVAACFRQFPEVLQLILEATLFRAPVDHRLQGDEYLRHAQLRQGQNQVAALLGHYLQLADEIDRRPPDELPQSAFDVRPVDDGAERWGGWDELAVR